MTPSQSAQSRRLVAVFCLLLFAFCVLPSTFGQSASATLSGTVEDQNGAVVPGATVTVENKATGLKRQATTNGDGSYTIPLLPPSAYTVTAQAQGFSPVQVSNVVLNVGDNKSLQIPLKAGNISEMVQIGGNAPLTNESAAVATVVDRQFVGNLPLNGRSFQSLIALTPGVVLTKSGADNQGQFSVNGQRANANYFTVDGVSANTGIAAGGTLTQTGGGAIPAFDAAGGTANVVSLDAMQEFRLQTSTFAPEFGRTPGAQISIVTRSGTNEFHATLFEYFRNEALDANDFFANSRGLRRSPLRQHNFGGVLGGPVLLPRFGEGGRQPFYNGRDRTFFFFSYEGNRLRLPQTQISTVPSLASRQAAPPQIRPYLNAYPVPNGKELANGFAEFNATYSDPSTLNATSVRIDHTFNNRFTVFGRYSDSPSESLQRGTLGRALNTVSQTNFENTVLTVGSTQTFTTSFINDLRINATRTRGRNFFRMDNFGGAVRPDDSLLYPPFAQREMSEFSLGILGASALLDDGNLANNQQRQINLVDNLSISSGSHQIKVGVDYRYLSPLTGLSAYRQNIFFRGFTGAPGGTLSGIAAFYINGTTESVALSIHNLSLYAQDTWKINSRLTLTYGMRWDVNPAPKGKNGKVLYPFTNLDNPAQIALAPTGTPLYRTRFHNIAPRIGLTWQQSQKPGWERILRGGFGIFYDLGSGTITNSAVGFPYNRFGFALNVPFPIAPAQLIPPPFSLNPPFGVITISDPELQLPYVCQWNVALEQSLGTEQTISASYVAAIGRRLLRQERLPSSPRYSTASVTRNNATSDYHALQLQFQRRLSRGLQVLASYSWSKSIDTISSDSTIGSPSGTFDARLDRGASDFDVRHSFSAAVTWNIPAPTNAKAVKALLGNWSMDAIASARSATPVDVTYFRSASIGSLFLRPDLNLGKPLYLNDPSAAGGRRFNPAAFSIPAASVLRQGTLGRNVLRGFSPHQINFALRRQFALTERVGLQLKAEIFNILNHPNFGDPSGDLDSSLFGLSTQMLGRSLGGGGLSGGFSPLYQIGGPRTMQLVVRFQF